MSILRSLVPAPLKPVARRVRAALRTLQSAAHHGPLPGDFRAAVGVKPVALFEIGTELAFAIVMLCSSSGVLV